MLDSFKQAYMPETTFPDRTIDTDKCSRCGRCYETCPAGGFSWTKGEVPVPIGFGGFKQACINCENCMAVCPSGAIALSGSLTIHKGRYKTYLSGHMQPPNPFNQEHPDYAVIEKELTEVERMIFTRRSNRLFKDKAVSKDMIHRVLEAGRFAPSAGNGQPYQFIVITRQAVINELESRSMTVLKLLKNTYLNRNGRKKLWKSAFFSASSYLMVNKFDPRPMTAMEKADRNMGRIFFNAPCVILILKQKHGISNPDLDAGICTQNMVLAAHAMGLGTCIVSLPMVPLSYPIMAGFRKKIGIKHPFEAVTSIAIGHPKGKIDGIVARDTPPVTWIE
ncbi:MAG: nitroreductase family protein [Desulfobacterales bacterium]|nr:nitroreductase family protein [Desulfobacterales bacterium]